MRDAIRCLQMIREACNAPGPSTLAEIKSLAEVCLEILADETQNERRFPLVSDAYRDYVEDTE